MSVYACKRLRFKSYLDNKGFQVVGVVPDKDNPNYLVWLYNRTPSFEIAKDEYFKWLHNKPKM